MKTCDEIIEENFTNQFTHSEKVIIKQLMQIVHRQACEEQIQLILDEFPTKNNINNVAIRSDIWNAKRVELK